MFVKISIQTLILAILLIFFSSCTSATHDHSASDRIQVSILHSLGGDLPVAQLDALPAGQRLSPVGYIGSQQHLEALLQHFEVGGSSMLPPVDFSTELVLFTRNMRFYNRLSIGRVNLAGDTLEVLSMSTMSARPIEDKVAMSLVVVEKGGARYLSVNGKKVGIKTE